LQESRLYTLSFPKHTPSAIPSFNYPVSYPILYNVLSLQNPKLAHQNPFSSSRLFRRSASSIINHIETPSSLGPLGPFLAQSAIPITQPHTTNNHIHNPELKHRVQVPRYGPVPASIQVGRSTARLLGVNGSSATLTLCLSPRRDSRVMCERW
jgi:hypothetical protein